MDMTAFIALVLPFVLVFYLVILLIIRPSRTVLLASLLGGVILGVINILFDLLAYYLHLWHYIFKGLILHLPLPFYISPILIYGSVAYLVCWRFWAGRGHKIILALLVLIPLLRAAFDIVRAYTDASSGLVFDSPLAAPLYLVMWCVMFFAGWFVFRRLTTHISFAEVREQQNAS